MGSTKLTLNVKSASLPSVKEYAKRQHTSVSKLVQEFFDSIVEQEKKEDPLLEKIKNTEMPDWIKQLTVVSKPVADFDHKAEYGKHLEEKYGI